MNGGAEHLARIHGTEEDKVNCPFYFKIGACRHGDTCSRQHHRPPFSETVLLKHIWDNPLCQLASQGISLTSFNTNNATSKHHQTSLDDFYEELYEECKKFGKIEDIQVCENLGDHMVGNVYIKYQDEEQAERAIVGLTNRYYACRRIVCEYSPVTDFKEARCRQFDEGTCNRGPYCNFMHVCEPSKSLRRYLEKTYGFRGGRTKGTGGMDSIRRAEDRYRKERRDRSRERRRDDDRRRGGDSRGRDRERDRERKRSRSRSRGRNESRNRDNNKSLNDNKDSKLQTNTN